MRNLLDDHKDLTVYPLEVTNFLERIIEASGFLAQNSIETLNFYLRGDLGVDWFGKYLPTGVGTTELDLTSLNRNAFLSELNLNKKHVVNPNQYFELVMNAYSRSQQIALGKCVMDVTSCNIQAYLHYFKNSKVVFMARNPFHSYNSYKRVYYKNVDHIFGSNFPEYQPQRYFERIMRGFENLSVLKNEERCKLVKLEDLQKRPKTVMTEVAQFIGILFAESLLVSSNLGKAFPGISLSDQFDKKNTYNIQNLNEDENLLTQEEKALLSNGLRCQDYYHLESTLAGKKVSLWGFLKSIGKWWKTSAHFPRNVFKVVVGLLIYYFAYRSYKQFIEIFFKRLQIRRYI